MTASGYETEGHRFKSCRARSAAKIGSDRVGVWCQAAGMTRLLAILTLASLLCCCTAGAEPLPGQMLLSGGNHVDLYRPASGDLRRVAQGGNEAVLFPSGEELAYIREVGCFPIGENGCYTEYSIFEKSLDEEATEPGRGTFGPTDFFVRAVDVTPRGRLVFSAKPGPGPPEGWERQMEIYSANLDGSGVTQLTHDEAFDNDPVVSPDGTRIAFSRRVHGRGQIFTMRLDGSHLMRVTRDRRRNRLPAWSPNGRRLVYLSQPAGHNAFVEREIYSVAAGGGRGRRLTRNETSEEGTAAYSPDGRSIAFLNAGGVWVMGADGSSPHRILSAPGIPSYEDLDWGPLP